MMNYLFPLFAVVLWGGNTVVTKVSSAYLAPLEISFYRWLLAVLVLTPFVLRPLCANWAAIKSAFPKLIGLGIFGCVVFQSLAYFAAHYTTATNMGIIQSLIPLITLILSVLFMGHRPTAGSFVGIAISVVGVTLAVSHGDLSSLVQQGLNLGDGLMLVAALAFALYGFFVQKWRVQIPLIQSVYVQAIVAAVVLLPFFLLSPKQGLSLPGGACVSFATIAASILAPLAWMHGISKLGAARVSLFFNLVPVFTILIAAVVLPEPLSVSVLVGGALTILGVVIAELSQAGIKAGK